MEAEDVRSRVYSLAELRQMIAERRALPEGEIPAPPDEIAAKIGELMDGHGEGSTEAKEWLEAVGLLITFSVPDEEFHPLRMNKACERVVESLKLQSPLKLDALWTAVQGFDQRAGVAKPLNLTRNEFDRAVAYLVSKSFVDWADEGHTALELLDSDSDPE